MRFTHRNLVCVIAMCNSQHILATAMNRGMCASQRKTTKRLYNSLEPLSSLWQLRLYSYPRAAEFILQTRNKVAQLTPARDGWLKLICLLTVIANPHSTKTYVISAVPCYPTGAVHFGLPCCPHLEYSHVLLSSRWLLHRWCCSPIIRWIYTSQPRRRNCDV